MFPHVRAVSVSLSPSSPVDFPGRTPGSMGPFAVLRRKAKRFGCPRRRASAVLRHVPERCPRRGRRLAALGWQSAASRRRVCRRILALRPSLINAVAPVCASLHERSAPFSSPDGRWAFFRALLVAGRASGMLNRVVAHQPGAPVELGRWLVASAKPGRRSRWSQVIANPSHSCPSRTYGSRAMADYRGPERRCGPGLV